VNDDLKGLRALADIWRNALAKAVAEEREACAKVADETSAWCRSLGAEETAENIAAAIRARGEKTT
jgi:dihydroxyacetone kinase